MEKSKKLIEEINRFKSVNRYVNNLMTEQAVPPPPEEPTGELPQDPTGAGGLPGELPTDPAGAGSLPGSMPGGGATAPPAGEQPPTEGDEPPKDTLPEPSADDSTEEIDMTDLVNMTKSIKKDLENRKESGSDVDQKMDGVFNKISELESKLGEMDNILAKIDELGNKIEQSRPKTPVEKLEMRSLDSSPFSQKPDDFFQQKQIDMKNAGKEYVLTKGDIENYSKDQIQRSFSPNEQEFNSIQY